MSLLAELRSGGKPAMARALARIERDPHGAETIALLDAAWDNPLGHVIGLTGPPGVGKSTLTSALIARWRAAGLTVGVIAVDPSSQRTGGALLGDRTRLILDPEDQGIFVRSMAARDRLGGLAALTFPAMVLMRAVYDRVLIETVGVGQSETDVTQVADTVVFCVQPASGDSLQFMKAGIVEIPHVAVVTKADLGVPAIRARADLVGALSLAEDVTGWKVPVVLVSSTLGDGMDKLMEALDGHHAHLSEGAGKAQRAEQGSKWLTEAVREEFGRRGLARAGHGLRLAHGASPFGRAAGILAELSTAP
ncbi:ArgK/MeaB family GTPase [Zavarzinia sp.]|uniref:ArgK/MeaB family GTPase n=1 Tax=Zavarzinia sp. TaxID=2027920 RepID=UPI003565237D